MKHIFILVLLAFISCKTKAPVTERIKPIVNTPSMSVKSDFTIAFGSGNNQKKDNPFWDAILTHKPNVWIWGGDNIYCDTEDMKILRKCYQTQLDKPDYKNFIKKTEIIGVWDDHDYGINDGGEEYSQKVASQDIFLDFLDVLCLSKRRKQEGTYHSKVYEVNGKKLNVILLDTRYFRSALTPNTKGKKRYKLNANGVGTMLGTAQWQWLENELNNSTADYNIIVSSIQFLSKEHGFEAWGNMPHEVEKLEKIIVASNAKRVFILSGDRHISEVSKKEIGENNYPLIDFTSSGLTHAYTKFKKEKNEYRVSKVIHQKSYGLVKFLFNTNEVIFEMWGEEKQLLGSYQISLE
ncbi:MAG TPA: alkaline phosphatase family protein [Lutibacter sp.]|nr:alkaline phosphatase family protein [Lutibacter sp.]